jgi:GntR family transcriptional regulator of arabinose operon
MVYKNEEKPKYLILKDYIIDLIKKEKIVAGDKIFSDNELVEKFDLSRHTVRHALAELVSEGWLYRKKGLGTFVKKDVDKFTVRNIGIIVTYLNDYIFPSIIRGIERELSKDGYNIILYSTYNSHRKERFCLENLLNQKLDGLIVEPTKSILPNPNLDLYNKLVKNGTKLLFMHGIYKELNSSYILENDEEAGYIATKYLFNNGHRKFGGIYKIDDQQGHQRYKGFLRALQEFEIDIDDDMIYWFETDELIYDTGFIKYNKIKNILNNSTALICYNDQVTLKVKDMVYEEKKKVPEDLSIISFDDSQLATASEVKMTTIAHPKEELGKEAGIIIKKLVNNNQEIFKMEIVPKLIERESVKNIK